MASSKGPTNKIKLTAKQQEQLQRGGGATLEGKELEERIAPMRVG